MHLADSSVWIEHFVGGPNAETYLPILEDPGNLIVPTIVIYEVCRFLLRKGGRAAAFEGARQLELGIVIGLDTAISLRAAKLGHQHNLPAADSIVYATAQQHNATLWTQDEDFRKLPGVRYFRKK
ncbi:MAG: type II toxin-antitoxin system VapC family toxin [Bryobacteraceae bacterium]